MSLEDDVKKNPTGFGSASNPKGAAIDAKVRAANAISNNPGFFNDPTHLAKIDDVVSIIRNTFGRHVEIHKNPRPNKGNPFTGVKFSTVSWPSRQKKTRNFYDPLSALGYTEKEIRHSRTGTVIRIY